MNSWRSSEFCAWAPPFTTFIMGTGNTFAASPPSQRKSETPASFAAARAAAREHAENRVRAEAPLVLGAVRLDEERVERPLLLGIASRERPGKLAVHVLDRLGDPFPPVDVLVPSRSSTASKRPVDAPDGTAARPKAPDSSRTSTSTVGLPRESRIWSPRTVRIGELTRAPRP